MKLVVTGGAGFLGYHLCNQLAKEFEEIRIIDIVPIKPEEYPSNAKYYPVDVRHADNLNTSFAGADLIIHAASALPRWKQNEIFDINVSGARNVLEAAKLNRISRVIFISSTTVYGITHKNPILENDLLDGVGIYGNSKVEAEKVFVEYRQKECVLRSSAQKHLSVLAVWAYFKFFLTGLNRGKKFHSLAMAVIAINYSTLSIWSMPLNV